MLGVFSADIRHSSHSFLSLSRYLCYKNIAARKHKKNMTTLDLLLATRFLCLSFSASIFAGFFLSLSLSFFCLCISHMYVIIHYESFHVSNEQRANDCGWSDNFPCSLCNATSILPLGHSGGKLCSLEESIYIYIQIYTLYPSLSTFCAVSQDWIIF